MKESWELLESPRTVKRESCENYYFFFLIPKYHFIRSFFIKGSVYWYMILSSIKKSLFFTFCSAHPKWIWKMLDSSKKFHESLVQYFPCSDRIVKQFLSTRRTEWCNLGVRKSGYDDTKEEFLALYELIDRRWPWPLNVDVKSTGSIIPIRLGSFSVFNYT